MHKMRVIEIETQKGEARLQLGSRDIPAPRPDEILIKTCAAGVNGPDILQRKGLYPPPAGASDLIGLEVSGEIVAIGENVSKWQIGDAVCALTNGGGYAEYVAVHADHALRVPDTVSLIDAAGLPETYFTVWSNLWLKGEMEDGTRLLVHGGAGGIGSTAIQLGKLQNCEVITTVRAANFDFVKALGADTVIDYQRDDFVKIVKDKGGADVILDIIGGEYIARNMKAARLDARIVQLAFNQGAALHINLMPLMLKRLTMTGSTLRSRPDAFKARVARDLQENVWPHFKTNRLRALTQHIFPFEEANAAHQLMERAGHRGKILLTPSD